MNADGTGQRQLTVEIAEPQPFIYHYRPAWSPDGTKVAFVKLFAPEWGIYVIGADSTGAGVLLIRHGDFPSWSPDGTKIAFASGDTGAITVADANSGAIVRTVTSDGIMPCWSPDGSKIAFVSGGIMVINADGSGLTPLNVLGSQPNWSPDGTKIVFSTGGASVWMMNADGSGAHDLNPNMPDASSPDWQRLPAAPVGGLVEPVNKVAVLVPWLTIVGSVAGISVVIVASWKKPEN